jgi:hypothetical protein
MTFIKIVALLTISVMTTFSVPSVAQDKPDVVLFGDFESFPCSEFRGIVDTFMADLANDPDSYGYVVNSGSFDKLTSLVWREELIRSHLELRNFDSSRISFDLAESVGTPRTRLWIVSPRTPRPKIENVKNSLSLASKREPFILTQQTFFNDSECLGENYPRLFARFLKSNPQARGNLLIYGRTSGEIRSRERNALFELVSTYGIERKRVRIFHRLNRNDPENLKGIEYWYLP